MAIALNTVIVDGQEYKPGDVIPDFKSIKCVDTREPRKYQGLSADVSVLNDVIAKYASGGASCFMSDTGEYYEYDRKEKTFKLITNITERGFGSEKAYGALKHMLKNVSVSDEKIQSAVTDYLRVNPVLPGATTEQAQQIEQNKTDVASLKEETGSLKEDLAETIGDTDKKISSFVVNIVKFGVKTDSDYNIVSFFSNAGDNFVFINNSDVDGNILATYNDDNTGILMSILAGETKKLTIPKATKSLGFYFSSDGTVNIEIHGSLYDKIMDDSEKQTDEKLYSFANRTAGKNKVNPDLCLDGQLVTDSGFISDSKTYFCTGLIPVKKGESIAISPRTRTLLFYDASENPISSSFDTTIHNDYVVQASSDGFIRVCAFKSDSDKLQVEISDSVTPYEPYIWELDSDIHLSDTHKEEIKDEIKREINDLSGKKIMFLGDSITAIGNAENGWAGIFCNILGAEYFVNVAVWGATLMDTAESVYDGNPVTENANSNVLGNQVQKILNSNYESPDIIMIAIGTNGGIFANSYSDINAVYFDSNNELIPLETVDRKTSAGAFRYANEKLHEKYPDAIIFWCTPIFAAQKRRTAMSIVGFGEALKKLTQYAGIRMIDTLKCGIMAYEEVANTEGVNLYDGLHPNVKGASKIATYNALEVSSQINQRGFSELS